jgi:hypothetical protein
MTIEIWEVVNYEVVSKMLNLLYSQNPYSISLFFHPNSASNPPKIAQFCLSLKKVDSLNLKQWVVTFFKGKSI